jgi:hypothetical protein
MILVAFLKWCRWQLSAFTDITTEAESIPVGLHLFVEDCEAMLIYSGHSVVMIVCQFAEIIILALGNGARYRLRF